VFGRLLGWLGYERRSVDYADPALKYLYGASRTSSGEPVSVERAVALSAVWASVNLIAGSIASMPLVLYKRVGDDGRERFIEHPLYDVLRMRPNPVQSVVTFWEAMVTALLLRGNAYALITRDDAGRVAALWFVNPDRVHVDVLKTGRLRYRVTTGGQTQTIQDSGMLHVVGPLSDDGYTGRSVIATFRETLGLGLALERYGAEFFANAATPKGVLTAPSRLSTEARNRLSAAVEENHTTCGRRHKTMILEEGLTFSPIGVSHSSSSRGASRPRKSRASSACRRT
jgi:HK97 family phage portal protein